MYKHLLVPTDGSKHSEKAMQGAIALAKSLKAKITGLYVGQPYPLAAKIGGPWFQKMTPQQFSQMEQQWAEQFLRKMKEKAEKEKLKFEACYVTSDSPYKGILKTAEKENCDLIVMASHGRKGIDSLLLGSEATKVLTHSTIPVLIYR